MRTPKAACWLLYSLVVVAGSVLFAVGAANMSGGGRQVADLAITLTTLGGMALWVHGNRAALLL